MKHFQRGRISFSQLIAIVAVIFALKIGFSIWEPYANDRLVNRQIEDILLNSPKNLSPLEFEQRLTQRLQMNYVDELDVSEILQIGQNPSLQIQKKYEVRTPFLWNIDLLLKFEKSFDQSSIQAK